MATVKNFGRAHRLPVFPVGGGDLVGQGDHEAPVIIGFLCGRLALEQRHRVVKLA